MTTGTRFSEEYTNPYSDVGQVDVASGWKPVPADSDPTFNWPRHMWELVLGLTQTERPHGELFAYRSIETDVLAFCMERVTGKRLAQLLSEEIWQKAGMEESACMTVDSAGFAQADGGLNASLRDYGRFGQMVLENGASVIPSSWIKATRHGNHGIFKEPYTFSMPQGAYRNQFWIEDPVAKAILAKGVFGQLIYINWNYNMVAVKLASAPDFLNRPFDVAMFQALHAIARALV
jgi:CubicO group peptidase (beta-lactamase class C family)